MSTGDPGDATALQRLESHPDFPRCPHGHGPLVAGADTASPVGVSVSCRVCGLHRALEVSELRDLLGGEPQQPAEPARPDDTTEIPRITGSPDATRIQPQPPGSPRHTQKIAGWAGQLDPAPHTAARTGPAIPRGQRPDGTIRTSGWLQIGRFPVSSGVWAAFGGLAAGLVLAGLSFITLLLAAAGWAAWAVATRWVWPASVAVNLQQCPASELRPGMGVRIHGPIGPVAVVDQVSADHGRVHLHFRGGWSRRLPATELCQVTELRN